MYLKIRTDFEFWTKIFLYVWIMADGIFFYLIPFYTYGKSMKPRSLFAIGPYVILLYIVLIRTYRERTLKKYAYASLYIFVTVIISVIQIAYSMFHYGQGFYAVFLTGHFYYSLIAIAGFLFVFESNNEEFEKMLRNIAIIGAINTLIVVFCALCSDFGIPLIFKAFTTFGSRGGHVRVQYRTMTYYSFFYFFTSLFKKDCKAKLIKILYLAIGLFGMVYYVNTRIIIISVSVAFATVFLLQTERKAVKRLALVVIVALVIYALFSNKIDTLVSSFSVDSELGGSTLARLMAIEYFTTYTKANPLMGMGLVNPTTHELQLIFSGPYCTAHFDDLGIMGGFYRLGLLGMVVMVAPLLRMIYLTYKIYKYRLPYSTLFVCIMSFVAVSQVSLNYLDFQRAVIASFYWAIMEYYYRKKKEELEI